MGDKANFTNVLKFCGWPCLIAGFFALAFANAAAQESAEQFMELGVAVKASDLDAHGPQIAREFTVLTTENALKWGALEIMRGTYDFSRADALVAFAEGHDMQIRGLTLLWTRLNGLPDWLPDVVKTAPSPQELLDRMVREHITKLVDRYSGQIRDWDVVNEPLANRGDAIDEENLFYATLGEDAFVTAFQVAHEADAAARLFIAEIFTENHLPRFDKLIGLVERLIAKGAPIHGVAMQGYFLAAPPDPEKLRQRMARIGELGLIVEITELDIPLAVFSESADPLAAQADAFADVVGACMCATACTGVTVWGLSDSGSWLGPGAKPLLFDEGMAAKPAYHAVRSISDTGKNHVCSKEPFRFLETGGNKQQPEKNLEKGE